MTALASPWVAAAVALVAAGLLLWLECRGETFRMVRLVAVAPLAAAVGLGARAGAAWAPLAVCLVAATLSRAREDAFHNECALKLVWVMGVSFALSWVGLDLLVLATGTAAVEEQWGVLQLGLDAPLLWRAALSLSLLAGVVLLSSAPFHFWAADLLQGTRAWLAPLAVISLQVSGAVWLARRLSGIAAFPEGARAAGSLLGIAAAIGLVAGAATLLWQRRPERRVGTLASLNGALLLASLAAGHGVPWRTMAMSGFATAWAAHLALALTGAATVARFLPVTGVRLGPAAVLFRRHPASGLVGLYALASLAGVPGTPGAFLWLSAARGLAGAGRTGLLLALVLAWLTAFAIAVRQAREALGVPTTAPPPGEPVPWPARAALWVAFAGLAALGVAWLAGV